MEEKYQYLIKLEKRKVKDRHKMMIFKKNLEERQKAEIQNKVFSKVLYQYFDESNPHNINNKMSNLIKSSTNMQVEWSKSLLNKPKVPILSKKMNREK